MNSKSAWRALGIVCSHYSPKIVAFVGFFFPFHDPWGLSPGSLLMFHHLSAPSRAARQKGCTAEPWKAASPNWEPNTPTRSPPWTTWPCSWRSRASWRRRGWGRWGLGHAEVAEVSRGRQFSSDQDKGPVSFLFPSFTGNLKILFMRSVILHVGLVLVSLLWNVMSHSIVAGEFDEMTPQDMCQASGTCQGHKLMKLFLRNPSFGCRYQIGPNSFDWVVGSQQQFMHFVQG